MRECLANPQHGLAHLVTLDACAATNESLSSRNTGNRCGTPHQIAPFGGSEDVFYEDWPLFALAASPLTCRCRHIGGGAHGVHRTWRRAIAAQRWVQRLGVVRLPVSVAGQGWAHTA